MATEDKALQPLKLPKSLATVAKSGGPSNGVSSGETITRSTDYFNSTIAALRSTTRTSNAVRALYHKDGTVAAGVMSLVQVANSGFKVAAYDRVSGRFDAEGTNVVNAIIQGMDTLYDYSVGFTNKQTIASAVSVALKEVVLDGALSAELVLNKQRLPEKIQIVPYQSLDMKSNGKGGFYPEQVVDSGDPINLNIPNFFIADLVKDPDRTYADSFLEGSVNMAVYYNEFIEDMRRVVKRAGHSRISATLDTEKVIDSAKAMGFDTSEKIAAYMVKVQSDITSLLEGITPEEALVAYDAVEFSVLRAKADKSDYKEVLSAIANMTATSLKSSPSILGMRSQGSQSLSNTESLVFIKIASAIQTPVEDVFSRSLTLGTRLFGLDVFCKFKFNAINLRPEDEMSAYRSMQEDRIMQKLSLGLISDEEAAWQMGVFPLPEGYVPRSGTDFHKNNSTNESTRDNSDKKGANETNASPDTPNSSGGADNEDKEDNK